MLYYVAEPTGGPANLRYVVMPIARARIDIRTLIQTEVIFLLS